MSCPRHELLETWLSGAEDEATRDHVAGCPACAASCAEIRAETALLLDLRRALGDAPASTPAAGPAEATAGAGDAFPPGFVPVRPLGSGGQGEVHEVVQRSTGRRAALKLLRQGPRASAERRSRFLREIRLAASLEHPGLATVYEAGETPEGSPYLAMELVRGVPWDAWADGAREPGSVGSVRRLLTAFLRLCEALAHAHAKGVLHRDLKPSNVLVDAEDRPRVLDLGLARRLPGDEGGDEAGEASDPTRTGAFLGSLGWMSPERIAGSEVGFQADVYSLGLLLHRALTGRHAFPIGRSLGEIVRGVQALPGSLRGPFAPERRLDAACLAILSKALQERPQARYADAGELARDVERVLAGAAPRARAPRRPRRAAALAAVALATLGIGLLLAPADRRGARSRGDGAALAWRAVDLAASDGAAARELLRRATLAGGVDPSWAPPEPGSARLERWSLAAAHVQRRLPLVQTVELDPERRWRALATAADARRLVLLDAQGAWDVLDLDRPERLVRIAPDPALGAPLGGVLDPTGLWCAASQRSAAGRYGLVLHHLGPGLRPEARHRLPGARLLSFAPGRPWAAVARDEEHVILLLDLGSGAELVRIRSEDRPVSARFLPSGERLVIQREEGRCEILDARSGERVGDVQLLAGNTLQPLTEETWLTWATEVFVADVTSGEHRALHRFAQNPIVATGLAGGHVVLGSHRLLSSYRPSRTSSALSDWVQDDAWTLPATIRGAGALEEGRRLALLTDDQRVLVLDVELAGLPERLSCGQTRGTLADVAALGGAGWLSCQGTDLLVLGAQGRRSLRAAGEDDRVLAVLLRDGPHGNGSAVFSTARGAIGELDLAGSAPPRWLQRMEGEVSALGLDPGGERLAAADLAGNVLVWPAAGAGEALRARFELSPPRVADLAWGPTGEWLACALVAGRVGWWRPGEAARVSEDPRLGPTRSIAVHPTSGTLVTGHDGGWLAIWELGEALPRERLASQGAEGNSVWALAFDPSGRFLGVGAGTDVAVWDWEERRPLFAARDHDGRVFALAFHPRLPRLASAAEDGELFVWDFAADPRLDALAQR